MDVDDAFGACAQRGSASGEYIADFGSACLSAAQADESRRADAEAGVTQKLPTGDEAEVFANRFLGETFRVGVAHLNFG
jgi:hypothetical protein